MRLSYGFNFIVWRYSTAEAEDTNRRGSQMTEVEVDRHYRRIENQGLAESGGVPLQRLRYGLPEFVILLRVQGLGLG